MAEQLRKMNKDISTKTFATVVLGSLPESYDKHTSLNIQKIEELKWENIKALLIEEHLKRTEKGAKQPEVSGQNEALSSKKGNMFGKKRNQENNPRNKSQERSLNETRCCKCGKLVHIARNCSLNKKDSRNQLYFADGNGEVQASPKKDEVALSSASSQGRSKLWYIDSGATKHKTSEKLRI